MGLIIYFSMGIGRGFIMGMEVGQDIVNGTNRDGVEVEMEHTEVGCMWIELMWMLWYQIIWSLTNMEI